MTTPTTDDAALCAYHEAGHAVMQLVAGGEVVLAWASGGRGLCRCGRGAGDAAAAYYAAVCVAGGLAEARVTADPRGARCGDDFDRARAALAADPDAPPFDAVVAAGHWASRRPRAAVEAVAAELLRHGSAPGRRVRELFDASPPRGRVSRSLA